MALTKEIYILQMKIYSLQGDVQNCFAVFKKLIKTSKPNREIYNNFILAHFNFGDSPKAEEFYEKMLTDSIFFFV